MPKPAAAMDEPARPAAVVAAEIREDIAVLGPAMTQGDSELERLRQEVDAALTGGDAGGRLHEYPYKVQLVGAGVDRVPVRTIEARGFQTRYTRTLYDASRALAELLRLGRKGAPAEVTARRAAFAASSDRLRELETDWKRFVAQHTDQPQHP
jgi:hypothetical protein